MRIALIIKPNDWPETEASLLRRLPSIIENENHNVQFVHVCGVRRWHKFVTSVQKYIVG